MIKEYIKDNKKYYEVKNHYIGINVFTGKEKRINKKGFTSKRQAEKHIIEAIYQFENNTSGVVNSNIKFSEFYNLWYEQHIIDLKGSTIANIQTVTKHILKHFNHIEVKKITAPICQQFINKISDNLKRSTVANVKSYLSNILEYAVKIDLIHKNPVKYIKIPKNKIEEQEEQEKPKFYTKEELQEFLEIVKNNYDLEVYLIFRLLAYTGARKGELMALTWNDIDFKNCTVNINKTTARTSERKPCINSTKTKGSTRTISIDATTMQILKEYRLKNKSLVLGLNIFTRNYDFYCNLWLKKIYKSYPKLKRITVHSFRHTHASLLFEAGASVKEVQERLGHSDIKTTMNVYTHLNTKQKEKTADIFANFMAL